MKLEINIIYQIVYNEDNYNGICRPAVDDCLEPKFKDITIGKYVPDRPSIAHGEELTVELVPFNGAGNRWTDEDGEELILHHKVIGKRKKVSGNWVIETRESRLEIDIKNDNYSWILTPMITN